MRFNFRNIDGDKFIGQVEQSHDFLNVLKFFNEEKLPITIATKIIGNSEVYNKLKSMKY